MGPGPCHVPHGPSDYGGVPVMPGAVIVNSGGTLMHLSGGRIGATLHRVNTTLIPEGQTRVSLPFFLVPSVTDRPLIPFGKADAENNAESGYNKDRNLGIHISVNRMRTFPQVTKRWWREEFEKVSKDFAEESMQETQAAYDLANRRAEKNKGPARL